MERQTNSHSRPSVTPLRKLKRLFRDLFTDRTPAGRPRRRSRLGMDQLEDRLVPASLAPTGLEQEFLERLNDARANPAAYGQMIDPSGTVIGGDGQDVRAVLAATPASQPLAFNTSLIYSSYNHSLDMSTNNYFGHNGSDGSTPFQRMSAAGFAWSGAAESIAAGQSSVETALSSLIIDTGVSDLGHRDQLLSIGGTPYAQENQTGVGVVMNGSGGYHNYYTLDSGYTSNTQPILLGVVYVDSNHSGQYDNGEGLGGVTITATGPGGTYQTTTWGSGGYSLPLVAGTYTVTASGGGLGGTMTQQITVGSSNYRLNFVPSQQGPQVTAAAVDSNAQGAAQGVILTFNEAINASTFTTTRATLTGPSGAITPTGVTQLSSTQFEVTFAPQATAGTYTLTVGPNVLDQYGNPMNQNGNAVNGESPGDAYTTTFALPMPQALPVSVSFADGVAHDFVSQSGTWSVGGSRYAVTPYAAGQDAVSLVRVNGALPNNLQLNVTMIATAASGGYYSNGFAVFDYQSPTNFKFAGAFVGNRQWVIGHRDANGWEIDAVGGDPTIAAGSSYGLQLMLLNSQVTLLVNGTAKLATTYTSAFTGAMGLATENAVAQFGNFTLQQVAGVALPYSENFSDGVAHGFVTQSGSWAVSNGRYAATPVNGGDAVSTLLVSGAVPSNLEYDVTMNATGAAGTYYSNGFLIFDYQSPTSFKYAGAFVGNQQWVIGHRDAAGWHNDAVAGDPTIAAATDYNLQLLLQGASASLVVNGVNKVGYGYASAFTGSLGLGTENSVTQYTNLTVKPVAGAALPYSENFADGQAHYFAAQSGGWSVSNGRYGAAPVNGGDALTEFVTAAALPASVELDVTMNAAAAAGSYYSNGFLIFDYQSPTNFKFAGAFVGLQEWVVGHRDATGWHIDAAAGDPTIAAGTDYNLQLQLNGGGALLLVNGATKVGTTYASAFTGSLGLGSENGLTQFTNFTVKANS